MDKAKRAAIARAQRRWLTSLVAGDAWQGYRALKPQSLAVVQEKYVAQLEAALRSSFPVLTQRWSPSPTVLRELFGGRGVHLDRLRAREILFDVLRRHFARNAAWLDLLLLERAIAQAMATGRTRVGRVEIERRVRSSRLPGGRYRVRDGVVYIGLQTNLLAQYPQLDPATARRLGKRRVTAAVFRDGADQISLVF